MAEFLRQYAVVLLIPILGGVLLGITVRNWLRGHMGRGTFSNAVRGVFLGGISLIIGILSFVRDNEIFLLLAAAILFPAATIITALIPDSLIEPFGDPAVSDIAKGGLLLLLGVITVLVIGPDQDIVTRIVGFVVFGGLGITFLFSGLKRLYKG